MNTTLHLDRPDDFVKRVCRAAFPDYTGRKVKVEYTDRPVSIKSYWSGGSRDYYAAVRLADCAAIPVPENGSGFTRADFAPVEIPDGVVLIEHSIFCGKDMGLTIHARPHSLPVLPAADDLSDAEAKVLIITASRKSSYAGISDYRKHELTHAYNPAHRVTAEEVDAARVSLRAKGHLDGRNAITASGRNAVANHPLRYAF